MITEWHENQVAAWKTQIRRHSRAFCANRAFGYLHNYIRSYRVDTRNVLYGDSFSRALISSSIDFFNTTIERSRNRVPEMKERIFLEADVNKHRLQAHLDVSDLTLVNAAHDVP